MFEQLKNTAPTILIVIALALKLGLIGTGKNTPEMLFPAKA